MSRSELNLQEALREARREKGITQSELAVELGCRQSAISMFEQGKTTALARKKVVEMAERLGVDIKSFPSVGRSGVDGAMIKKMCPVPDCPSNVAYLAGGRACVMPVFVDAVANEKTRCRFCGEILESRCSNTACVAPLEDGGFCMRCGSPYVSVWLKEGEMAEEWVATSRSAVRELRHMAPAARALLTVAGEGVDNE